MNDIDRRTVFVAGLAAASLISTATEAAAGSPEARLRELGIELPKVTAPVANYVPSARLGNIIFLAGAGPLNPDGSRPQGKVGRDVTLEQANQHARNVGLQLLAALREAAGSLDKVVRFGRVFGMVNAVANILVPGAAARLVLATTEMQTKMGLPTTGAGGVGPELLHFFILAGAIFGVGFMAVQMWFVVTRKQAFAATNESPTLLP